MTTLACFALAARRGSPGFAAIGGSCLFLATTFRPPVLLHGVACLPFVWMLWQRYSPRNAVQVLASACVGFALMLGLFFWDALASDFGEDFLTVLKRNRQYGSLASVPGTTLALTTATTLARILLDNACALLLVTMSAVVCWRSTCFALRQHRAWCVAALLLSLIHISEPTRPY